jgi:hypothetical protein
MMKKSRSFLLPCFIAIFLLITVSPFWVSFQCLYANDTPVTMKYVITFNGVQKGSLFLCIQNNAFYSFYTNIQTNDRLPFFSASKTGRFDQWLFSSELDFSQKKYMIYYHYKNLPKNIYTHKAYRTDNKAFIVDQKKALIKYVIDKIPVLSFENIIIGFMNQKIPAVNDMILFEDETKTLFRIYFELKNKEKKYRSFKQTKCAYTTYNCFRKNASGQPEKKIFELDVSEEFVPLRISAISGRWEIILDDIFEGTIQLISLEEYISQSATQNLLKKYNINQSYLKSPIEIVGLSPQKQFKSFDCNYKIEIDLSSNIQSQKRYAARCLSRKLFPEILPQIKDSHIDKTIDGYQVKVSLNEISSYILQSNYFSTQIPLTEVSITLSDFIQKINQHFPAVNLDSCVDDYDKTVLCVEQMDQKFSSYDIYKAAQLYLQTKDKLKKNSIAVKDASIYSETMDSESVYIAFASISPNTFPTTYVKKSAKHLMLSKLLGKHYIQYPYKHIDNYIKSINNDYIVDISNNQICQSFFSTGDNTVVFTNNTCQISGTYQILESKIEDQIRNSTNTPNHKEQIIKNNHQWFFSNRIKSLPICQ